MDGIWQRGEPSVPLSGEGSSIAATANIMRQLPGLLRQLECNSLLDIGCGDMTWMRFLSVPGYVGIDIVPAVVAENEKMFPDRRFHCLDAVTGRLPQADVALCRDVLFHLSFKDALGLLRNVRRSGARWLIATTDTQTLFNADIRSADFRLLNLRRAPFRFPAPVQEIADDALASGRSVSVWRMSDLPL